MKILLILSLIVLAGCCTTPKTPYQKVMETSTGTEWATDGYTIEMLFMVLVEEAEVDRRRGKIDPEVQGAAELIRDQGTNTIHNLKELQKLAYDMLVKMGPR